MDNPSSPDNAITPFAITNYRDIRRRFGIRQKNRRGHMYIVGKTGTGKSTLLLNMASHDMEAGYGLALIDPHGDLAEEILDCVPSSRINDVIYLNPSDLEYPLAFNPLDHVARDQRDLVVSGMISTLKKVWSDFWGPRLEHILRNALLTLLENPESTLLDVPRLLTDEQFRELAVRRVTHPQVRNFWFSEFAKYSAWMRSEAVSPILNKVGQFLTSTPLRNIVGQRKSALRFRKIMDEGKIFIANLSKGRIGEDNSSLLGAMLVTRIQLAALSRTDLPEARRRPFYFYVDEFHDFLTLSFADILSSSRKYGLNLVLAHQHLGQLDEKLRGAILGNVGTVISFRVGAEDAELLAKEFYPVFGAADLVRLPNYHIYLKLLIDGAPSEPFSAFTLLPRSRNTSHKQEIIDHSRRQYAQPRREVEQAMVLAGVQPAQRTEQRRLI
ncbi:MAG TPA: type IV secretion system DNA-binding domain-containing protein [Gemmataceae bacterium]|jgi:type IV secretory pathway TraG/TraD family ATPase VirD4